MRKESSRGLLLLAGIVGALQAGQAGAQALSPGCAELNRGFFQDTYTSAITGTLSFFANELIEISAGPPVIAGTPTGIELQVASATVDSDGFPGVLSYQFPGDTTTVVRISTTLGTAATWSVGCSLAPPPPPPAAPPAPTAAEPVPTLPLFGLLCSILGLGLAGVRYQRRG